MTRHGRVVFYDYDEIEYLTDCAVREVPAPRSEEDEMASEPWYTVGPHDIFPETYGTFLLGDPRVRRAFLAHHADFFRSRALATDAGSTAPRRGARVFPVRSATAILCALSDAFAPPPPTEAAARIA